MCVDVKVIEDGLKKIETYGVLVNWMWKCICNTY